MWKRSQSRAKMEIQEFQDGRTSTLDPEASNLVKFIMFARLSCAISTHIVCLDVDHRLLLVIGVIKSVHLSQWKNSYVVRCKWDGTNDSESGLTCYLDRYKFEICNTPCLLFQLSSSCSRCDNTTNEWVSSLLILYIYIREYLLNY